MFIFTCDLVHVKHNLFKQFILGISSNFEQLVDPLLQTFVDGKFVSIFHVGVDLLGELGERVQRLIHFDETLILVACLIVLS